jgi:hypothetical protein
MRAVVAKLGAVCLLAGFGAVTASAQSPQTPSSGSVTAPFSVVRAYGGGGSAASTTPLAVANWTGSYANHVILDSAGNIYIAEYTTGTYCHVYEIVASTQQVLVIAGGGSTVPTTTAMNGSLAEINPYSLAIDNSGNLYVADYQNALIEKITGLNGGGTPQIVRIAGGGASYPTATAAAGTAVKFSAPGTLLLDGSGNLYVADSATGFDKITNPSTSPQVTLLGGTGSTVPTTTAEALTAAKLQFPSLGAFDASGNLYLSDSTATKVFEITALSGTPQIQLIAGGGSTAVSSTAIAATSASLVYPAGLVFDGSGNLYLADDNYSGTGSVIDEITGLGTATPQIVQVISTTGVAADATTRAISTVSSNGPYALYADANGYLSYNDEHIHYNRTSISMNAESTTFAGSTAVGSTSATVNVLVKLTSATALSGISVANSENGSSDFTLGTVTGCIIPGTSTQNTAALVCTVPITFNPQYPGLRSGELALNSNSTTIFGTVGISGTGTGPQTAFTPGIISTVAGNGTGGYVSAQDGGTATSAEINNPNGVAVDGAGNLYIADDFNQRIRKVTAATGIITTVAGNGTQCTTSATTGCLDGGAATSAKLYTPSGVAVDGAGNFYIADENDMLIRKVTAATGIITTVAGNGSFGYSGDNGAATSAKLQNPTGVAVDSAGNLYIADEYNHRIRKVTAGTGIITTVAGTSTGGYVTAQDGGAATSAELYYPNGIAVDGAGNLYIADSSNNRIRKVTAVTGIITTVAGNGTGGYSGDTGAATSAELHYPTGCVVDGAGNLYIADTDNHRIRMVAAATGIITTVAGNGTSGYVSAQDGGGATSAELNNPTGVVVDGAGNLYIADSTNNRIRKVTVGITPQLSFAATAIGSESSDSPQSVTVYNTGNKALTVAVPTTGTNPSVAVGYSVDAATTCPSLSTSSSAGTLAAGAACKYALDFVPVAGGTDTGSAVITDNALNATAATQSITLSGTGTLPPQTITFTQPTTPYALGGSTVTLVATGGASGNAVVFTIDGSSTATGNISGTTLTITGAGNLVIDANQAGNSAYAAATQVQRTIVVTQPTIYTVNKLTDPSSGTTSNCNTGNSNTCSFRDALAAAASSAGSSTPVIINFAPALTTGGPVTITTGTGGTFTLPAYTAVQGTTSGSGSTLTNLVTISGGNAHTIFYTPNSATVGVVLSNLNITNGKADSGNGGALYNYGSITFNACNITNNTGSSNGGALYGNGSITINDSTVSNNSSVASGAINISSGTLTINYSTLANNTGTAGYSQGGAIYATGPVVLNNVTISGNSASQQGGAYLSGASTLNNTVIEGNTATIGYEPDAEVDLPNGGTGNVINTSLSATSNANLGTLASNGGPTQTMLPLLGGAAFCAGSVSAIPSGFLTDQRGFATSTIYTTGSGSKTCVDAGAAQTGYSMSFVQQPTQSAVNANISPAPTVQLTSNGSAASISGISIAAAFLNVPADLTGTTSATTNSSGLATFSAIAGNATDSNEQIVASTTINSTYKFSATSNSFNIVQLTPTLTSISPTSVTAGASNATIALTGTNFNNGSTANFNGSAITTTYVSATSLTAVIPSASLTSAGSYPVTVTNSPGGTSGSQTFTVLGATTTTLTSSANPQNVLNTTYSLPGTVTFTATVTPSASAPTGTVTFKDGASNLSIGALSLVSGNYVATYTTTALTQGSHSITAVYNGNSSLAASTSSVLTQIMSGTPSAIAITSGNNQTAAIGQPFALPITFLITDSLGNPVPGGQVGLAGFSADNFTFAGGVSQATANSSGVAVSAVITAGPVPGTYIASSYSSTSSASINVTLNVSASASYTAPTTAIGVTSATQTAYVTITTAGTPSAISVTTQGATGLDFTLVSGGTCSTSTAYTVGQTCSILYTFKPGHPGLRMGSGTLSNGSGTLGNSYLMGIGTGPQIVYTPGVQSTIGSGWGNVVGITVDASGNVYVADYGHNQVWKETLSGGVYTASIVADNTANYGLHGPSDVTVDGAGNVYIADNGNGRVVKETLSGGTYTQSLVVSAGAYALTVDGAGNVYFPNGSNVMMETLQLNGSYVQSTIGSGMNIGYGSVRVDGSGNLFIGDQYDEQVVKETLSGGSYTQSVIANGFQWGVGVAVDAAGDVFVADAGTAKLYKETPSGSSYTQSLLTATLSNPLFMSIDGSGNLYVGNNGTQKFLKLDMSDAPTLTFASTNDGSTSAAQSITISNNGNAALTAASTGLAVSANYTQVAGSGTPADCTTTFSLASGASCNISLEFAPVSPASGAVTGTTVLTDNNLSVSSATQTINLTGTAVLGLIAQSITFTPASPITYSVSPITLTATGGGSGNPVTFSILSGPGTLSGTNNATLTLTGVGAIQIAANQAGNGSYLAAPQVTHGIFVSAASSYTAPTTAVGTTSATQAAYVTITTAGTLNTISVLTQGATGLDFNIVSGGSCSTSTAYSVSQTCSVFYTFKPGHPGQRLGGIALFDSSGKLLSNTYLNGIGTGPQIAYGPGAVNTLGSGFGTPYATAVDGNGDVFVADQNSGSIKEMVAVSGVIPASPTIKTIASGISAPTGVAVDGSGNVYYSDGNNAVVKEVVAVGGVIPASPTIRSLSTSFTGPFGLAVDSLGDVFVADYNGSAVREIVAVNGVIPTSPTVTTLGSGFSGPRGVAVDASGNVYVADSGNGAIKEMIAVSGVIPASPTINTLSSGFNFPLGVAVDSNGNVYVDDTVNRVLKEIVAVSGVIPASPTIVTLASGFTSGALISLDGSGNVYIADFSTNLVSEYNVSTAPSLTFASTNDGSTSAAQSVTITNNGNAAFNAVSPGLAVSSNYTLVAGSGTPADCTATFSLASGASCNLSLEFAPVSPASGTTTGTAVLTDNNLNVTSATQTISLSGTAVLPTPTVTAVSPANGSSAGGTSVTITGTNLSSATAVKFGTASGTITANTATSITVTSPAGSIGTVDVTVATLGGTSATSAADKFSYLTAQTISFTQPTTPYVLHSGTVALTATGGASGNAVVFTIDGTSTGTGSISGTTLTVTGAGNLIIDANQAGNSTYAAATQVQRAIVVSAFGTATQLVITSPFAPIALGSAFGSLTAAYEDVYGNVVTTQTTTTFVEVTNGTGYSQAPSVAAVNGVATISYSSIAAPTTPGVYTVLVAAGVGGITQASSSVIVAASSYTANTRAVASPGADTAYILFANSFTLGSISVVTQGATGLDYVNNSTGTCTVGTTYAAGSACSVGYNFGPLHPGSRYGAILIYDNSTTPVLKSTTLLNGIGTGPQIAYGPGVQRTIGSGWGNAAGVAVDASGNVYIVDQTHKQVWKETLSGSSYTPSIVADSTSNYGLNQPTDVAVDGAGNVYIADQGNGRIVKETLSGGTYTQSLVVSVGAYALTVDGSGNVYLPNGANVLMETLQPGGSYVQSTIGSGMQIGYGSVKVDSNGNLYIGDQYDQKVVKETLSGGSYTPSVIANGFQWGNSIALDAAGDVYVADQGTGKLYKETPSGSSYSQSTLATNLNGPIFMNIDGSGNLYISNNGADQFIKLDLSDAPTLAFASTNDGSTSAAQSVTITNNGNTTLTAITPGLAVSTNYTQVAGSGTPADCTATFSLASGASCNLSLEFAPTGSASGITTGTTVLTDNNLNVSSATQTINLTGTAVAVPPVAGAVSATVAYSSTNNPITLNLSGGAAASVAVASAASHGTATASGTSITYTPTTGYSGADSFTYTATNLGGTSSAATVSITITAPQTAFVVNSTNAPTSGNASNCTTGNSHTCTLEDAITAANALGSLASAITFDSTVFSSGGNTSITLSSTLAVNGNVTITGNGITSTILNGGGTVQLMAITGSNNVSLSGLAFNNGKTASGNGGAINAQNGGTLTINGCSFNGNVTTSGVGGALYSETGTTTIVSNSLFTGNTATSSHAGAIYVESAHSMTLNTSTLTGNTSGNQGGAIRNAGVLYMYNSTVTGNTAVNGNGIINGNGAVYILHNNILLTADCNNCSLDTTNATSGLLLAPLGNYGGTMQTMLPLPGSSAIGKDSTSTLATDVRGYARSTTGTSDAGAVQTGYAATWSTQPPSITMPATNFTAAVTLTEQGNTLNFAGTQTISLPVTLTGTGTLTGSPLTSLSTTGITTGTFQVSAAGTGDTLTALGVASASFNVVAPPVAAAVSATVSFNSTSNPITLNLSGGAAVSVTVASAASHGTATASSTTIKYTPTTGYTGSDSFTYTATNTAGTSTAATVSITVNPAAPVAGVVTATVSFNSTSNPITLNLSGGAAASVAVASAASHGTATASGTSITYTPANGYTGSDSFTYTATNVAGTSSPATASITVNPAAPVAGVVTATVAFNSTSNPITLNLSGGAAASVTVASAATHGTATANGTSITYTPANGYTGSDSFTYTATNATATSAAATVSITVNPAAPVAGVVTATVSFNSTSNPITLNLSGGAAASVAVASAASHGTATASGTSITYTPANGYTGSDSFTYTATNVTGTSSAATVSITVKPAAPIAGAVSQQVLFNSTNNAITLNLSGGAAASVAVASAATHGTATASGTSITYTPSTGYTGTDSFTYTATNATTTSVPATVSIQVGKIPVTITLGNLTPTYNGSVQNATATTVITSSSAPVTVASITYVYTSGSTTLAGPPTAAGSYGVTATVVDTAYQGSATGTMNIGKVTATVSASPVSRAYGVANPVSFTSSSIGFIAADGITTSASVTATSTSAPGPYAITVAIADPNVKLPNYTVTNNGGVLTITQAATATSFTQTTPTTSGVGSGVSTTFTAAVTDATANSVGTPTGTVQFLDGGTAIGSGTLNAGIATVTTSFTTTGTHIITAVYSSDTNFAASTSSAFNEVVVTPGFSIASNPNALSITRGTTGTATITFTPVGNYQGTSALACNGLPSFTSCIFSPASITFTGNNAVQTAVLTVYTLNANDAPGTSKQSLLWLPAAVFACFILMRRRKLARNLRPLLMLAIAALALTAMTGCGSGASFVTPTGTDTVTVTATATATPGTSSSNTTQTAVITITITQ